MSYEQDAYASAATTHEERNKLVEEYLPLVRHILGRLPLSLPAFIDDEDLFEVGVIGLINAANSYSPSKGAQFKTYAYVNVRGAILDELRKHDMVPRSRRDRIKEFHKACDELEEELGRTPTTEEIAKAMGLSIDQVEDVLVNMNTASLLSLDDRESDGEGGGVSLAECVASMKTPNPSDEAEAAELKKMAANAIMELPDRERHVIVLYYAEGLRLKEIGEAMGVSESRISQIHGQALWRLNKMLTAPVKEP